LKPRHGPAQGAAGAVAPRAGAWIETVRLGPLQLGRGGRPPRGGVD